MKTAVALILMFAAQGQSRLPAAVAQACPPGGEGLYTYWYYEAVLDRMRPPDWAQYSVTIAFSPTPETKLILRTNGRKFELCRGTPQTRVSKFLDSLDKSCRLPPNPADTADMIKVNWKSAEISGMTFGRLHREFTAALAQYISDVKTRYPSVLKEGGVIHFHTPEYSIVYDNHGFEHLEIQVWDDTRDPAKMTPIARWVHELIKLSESRFPNP